MNHLTKIETAVHCKEGISAIEAIFTHLYLFGASSNHTLAQAVCLPIPLVTAIKKEGIKAGLLRQQGGACLTPAGIACVERELGYAGLALPLYRRLRDNPFGEHPELTALIHQLETVWEHRPPVDVTLDQSFSTIETALRRGLLCLQHSGLVGRRILCLGDDDFVSVAIGFLLQILFPQGNPSTSVVVIELDSRIATAISNIATAYHLPISVVEQDLRQPLPHNLAQQFDCFFTDPPYTPQGVELFLSRGLEGLKPQSGLGVYLSYAHRYPEATLALQKNMLEKGLTIAGIYPRFNQYEGAGILGNQGQMLVLETTGTSSPSPCAPYSGLLYTGEIRQTRRTYRCRQCGHLLQVGQGESYTTIESLQASGCTQCGHRSFARKQRTAGGHRHAEN